MTYWEKYGFNDEQLRAHLRLVELDEDAAPLAEELQEKVIVPHIDQIIDDFYDYMLQQPEFVKTIEYRKVDVAKLKLTQRDYLLSLGVDFVSQDYFERRLHIGVVHAWNSIPLSVYLGAYRKLQQLLINQILFLTESLSDTNSLITFMLKITTMDMALATETYHDIQVDTLLDTIDSLRNPKK